eukprot:TRINITY_DN61217_c0_g1_i1.p1 TRINITY_DN61217_c0_g1~~TRINITY_DN61217_c0_g1_i1.p1  ORF type:complete len:614 (+),score=197.68 TRINITY_DN61217_c0_g1_i1:201-1844(+)
MMQQVIQVPDFQVGAAKFDCGLPSVEPEAHPPGAYDWLIEKLDRRSSGKLTKAGDMKTATQYLRAHDIGGVLVNAVDALGEARPEDPRAFLSSFISTVPSDASTNSMNSSHNSCLVETPVKAYNGHDNASSFDSKCSACNNKAVPAQAGPPKHADPTAAVAQKTLESVQAFLKELEEHLVATINEWSAPDEAAFEYLRMQREARAMGMEGGAVVMEIPSVLVQEPQEDDLTSEESCDGQSDDRHGEGESESGSECDDDCEENQAFRNHIAVGVCETLFILKESLLGCNRGEVDVQLHVSDNCPKAVFQRVIEQFREVDPELQRDTGLEMMHFPVRTRRDEYRQMRCETHMLMWAQICVYKEKTATSEAKRFEIFVNVLGYVSKIVTDDDVDALPEKPMFDYYEVIPSFGQLINVQRPQEHRKLCNPDTVDRARSLCEAMHRFKLALVRVAEHIIRTVIQGEFLDDVSNRMSRLPSHIFTPPTGRSRSRSNVSNKSGFGPRRKSVSDVVEEMKMNKPAVTTESKPRRQSAPAHIRSSSSQHLSVEFPT